MRSYQLTGDSGRVLLVNQQQIAAIDLPEFAQVALSTLSGEGKSGCELNVVFVDDRRIHALNRKHLGHDFPTDVISFVAEELPPGSGELVISVEMAARKADEYHVSIRDEVLLYLVHGLLHLCGYDDLQEPERNLMIEREIRYCGTWGVVPVDRNRGYAP